MTEGRRGGLGSFWEGWGGFCDGFRELPVGGGEGRGRAIWGGVLRWYWRAPETAPVLRPPTDVCEHGRTGSPTGNPLPNSEQRYRMPPHPPTPPAAIPVTPWTTLPRMLGAATTSEATPLPRGRAPSMPRPFSYAALSPRPRLLPEATPPPRSHASSEATPPHDGAGSVGAGPRGRGSLRFPRPPFVPQPPLRAGGGRGGEGSGAG